MSEQDRPDARSKAVSNSESDSGVDVQLAGVDSQREARIYEELEEAGRSLDQWQETAYGGKRLMWLIDKVAEALVAAMLLAIAVILIANVTSRYVFNAPLGWTVEITTGLLVWLTMVGTFVAARHRELITVQVLSSRMPARIKPWVDLLIALIGAAGLAYLGWAGIGLIQEFGQDTTPYLRLPRAVNQLAIPVGVAIIVFATVIDAIDRFGLLNKQEQDPSAKTTSEMETGQ